MDSEFLVKVKTKKKKKKNLCEGSKKSSDVADHDQRPSRLAEEFEETCQEQPSLPVDYDLQRTNEINPRKRKSLFLLQEEIRNKRIRIEEEVYSQPSDHKTVKKRTKKRRRGEEKLTSASKAGPKQPEIALERQHTLSPTKDGIADHILAYDFQENETICTGHASADRVASNVQSCDRPPGKKTKTKKKKMEQNLVDTLWNGTKAKQTTVSTTEVTDNLDQSSVRKAKKREKKKRQRIRDKYYEDSTPATLCGETETSHLPLDSLQNDTEALQSEDNSIDLGEQRTVKRKKHKQKRSCEKEYNLAYDEFQSGNDMEAAQVIRKKKKKKKRKEFSQSLFPTSSGNSMLYQKMVGENDQDFDNANPEIVPKVKRKKTIVDRSVVSQEVYDDSTDGNGNGSILSVSTAEDTVTIEPSHSQKKKRKKKKKEIERDAGQVNHIKGHSGEVHIHSLEGIVADRQPPLT